MPNNLLSEQLSNVSLPSLASLDPGTLKITLIAFMIFMLLMLFAFTRHHLISLSLHGLGAGLIVGIILTLALEGGVYYLYTNYILGNKAASLPSNFQIVLEDTTKNLQPVLGLATERRTSSAKEVLANFESLPIVESTNLKKIICEK